MYDTVEHSDHVWRSLGRVLADWGYGHRRTWVHVWPIEEYLIRSKHKPNVAARIARLNPNGKPEGEIPRGIHYTRTIRNSRALFDICDRATFEKKWGKGSYRKLPKSAFVPMGGKRRAVTAVAYVEGPP